MPALAAGQGGGFRGALAGKGLGLGQGNRASLGRTEAALFSPLMGPAFPRSEKRENGRTWG